MIVICAWCQKKMGEKEPLEDKSETHTICAQCQGKWLQDSLRKDKPTPNK
jgi:hypothetical protein